MKTKIDSVLIPTDFSEVAESALKVGIAIARRQNAKIFLLHSIDNYAYLQPSEVFLHEARIIKDIRSQLEVKLQELADKIRLQTGVDTGIIVRDGSPSDAICRIALQEKISLIVMGTHGVSGMRKFFMGSESFRVIKHTFCPILTIPSNWQKTVFKKVVFPVRLKPETMDKYFYVQPIIEKNNSEVMLLGLAEQQNPEDLKEVAILIDKMKAQLFTDKISFRTAITRSDDFSRTIIDLAIDFQADLIILSSTIDHNFKNFFVGPFAQQVVNHSHLPVLSIKPSDPPGPEFSIPETAKIWGDSIELSGLGKQE